MMPTIDLKMLIGRMGSMNRRALEAAAGHALSRTNYHVEPEHWLYQLMDMPGTDVSLLADTFDIDRASAAAALTAVMDQLRIGNGRAPSLAPAFVEALKNAWLFTSAEQGQAVLRSGHLLWALLSTEDGAARIAAAVPGLSRLLPDVLRRDFQRLLDGSAEMPAETPSLSAGFAPAPAHSPALERFTIDLTAHARAGRIDPILGRDAEIRQVIDILTRRRQNNPIMTGEAGVGKTAVVEGLALRIAAGDVPPPLATVSIRTLDLGLLQAGASMKGEFENRLRSVIDEVQASSVPVILFVDEAHTLIGAGGAAGQGDAANLLKPPLARGELRVIAATTWAEYKKYIEKDAALARRFQPIKVEEPCESVAIDMVRGLFHALEAHHKVRILDEAATAAVRLSMRYLQGRQLPDKAVSLIDTACARVAMSLSATPPAVEDRRRRIAVIAAELRILQREEVSGADHGERLAALSTEREALQAELANLEDRWRNERDHAIRIGELRQRAEAAANNPELRHELAAAAEALRAVQGDRPMVFPVVDAQVVAQVIEAWTGIPAGRMHTDELAAVLNLRTILGHRIVGQDHALEAVSQAIRVSRAGLTDPRKPVGVFLMVGTSGVGKTETALTLADILYGGEQNLTTINMTEFKEEHKVSLLMGSPPGYVGYGEGGVLTEAVRRRPHSVLLLDEIEKAHPGVQDAFFQVFDKGTMKDGEGRDIDFSNTVIIMTSNAGTAFIDKLFADPATVPDAAALTDALRIEMANHFKPAFLGRVTLVPYLPLSPEILHQIVDLQLGRVEHRMTEKFGTSIQFSNAARQAIADRSWHPASGARSITTYLSQTLLPDLSTQVLSRMLEGQPITAVSVDLDPSGAFHCAFGDRV